MVSWGPHQGLAFRGFELVGGVLDIAGLHAGTSFGVECSEIAEWSLATTTSLWEQGLALQPHQEFKQSLEGIPIGR